MLRGGGCYRRAFKILGLLLQIKVLYVVAYISLYVLHLSQLKEADTFWSINSIWLAR